MKCFAGTFKFDFEDKYLPFDLQSLKSSDYMEISINNKKYIIDVDSFIVESKGFNYLRESSTYTIKGGIFYEKTKEEVAVEEARKALAVAEEALAKSLNN